jgi:3-methyladenine DNA glycosylase AlkD
MSSQFARVVRARLTDAADPKVKAAYESYLKNAVRFIGVRMPEVRRVFRELRPALSAHSPEELFAEARTLLLSPFAEEKHIAILLLARVVRTPPSDFVRRLEPVFDEGIREWATCDGISGRVLRPLLRDPAMRKRIVAWSRSRNQWRQRAAAVAFVNEARHGAHDDIIIGICERIVRNPERFVQLGMGWVLRELSLSDRPRVLGFLRKHYSSISREGLRYAIEKLPTALQKTLLIEHSEQSRAVHGANEGSGRRVPSRRKKQGGDSKGASHSVAR